MKKSNRYITSLLMAIIYLVIAVTPLAPLAMQSKMVAHAVTGECSGDCRIDGCSLERSAARSCCCAQKKLSLNKSTNTGFTGRLPSETPNKGASCCALKPAEAREDDVDTASVSGTAPEQKRTTTVSSRPCGSGKLFALLSIDASLHLPFFFSGEIPAPEQSTITFIPPDRLTSRYVDPPDPPPQNS